MHENHATRSTQLLELEICMISAYAVFKGQATWKTLDCSILCGRTHIYFLAVFSDQVSGQFDLLGRRHHTLPFHTSSSRKGQSMKFKRAGLLFLSSCIFSLSLSCPVYAESAAGAKTATGTATGTATDSPMNLVHEVEPNLVELVEQGKKNYQGVFPDPQATEKQIPTLEKVVEEKNRKGADVYASLSMRYFFADDFENADRIRKVLIENWDKFPPESLEYLLNMQLFYGVKCLVLKKYDSAEAPMLWAQDKFENNANCKDHPLAPLVYVCMSIIKEKAGKNDEALVYAEKFAKLKKEAEEKAKNQEPVKQQ